MTLERITKHNLSFAVQIHNEIFPEYSARTNYEESAAGVTDNEYYLIYQHENCVGITGIYRCPTDDDSAWLGWFGIREGFRKKHLGTMAMRMFEDMAIAKGYKYARLYTDELDNDIAIAFYRSNGYIGEPYINALDPASIENKVVIFSKSLTSDPVTLWNNKNIHLTEQAAKQTIG